MIVKQQSSPEDGFEQAQAIQPDVIIEFSLRNYALDLLHGSNIPVVFGLMNPQTYTDHDGIPLKNITGVYTRLDDMAYNSYKFLNKVAPLKPGQQVVFLENSHPNRLSKEEAQEALARLGIPLKAAIDATVYEDWQAAILRYNDDPDVGWVLMGVWPTERRDGSIVDMETEVAPWQREHLKKPMVTYWEIAVQWAMLCGFGIDLSDVGLQAGEMAARVLKGEDIKTIKAEFPRKTFVALNRKTADFMGITFSLDVLNLANVIYHDWEGKNVSRKSGLR